MNFIVAHCDWLALFFSITGLWFNGRKSMKCWPCWFASNIVWSVYAFGTRQPSLLILQVLFFIFNVIGYRAWKRDLRQQQIADKMRNGWESSIDRIHAAQDFLRKRNENNHSR